MGSYICFLLRRGGVADEEALHRLLDGFEAASFSLKNNAQDQSFTSSGKVLQLPTRHALLDTAAYASESAQPEFEWTDDAMSIKAELSLLAGVDPDSIDENTSFLGLGLDSIDTIKLSARLKMTGITLTNSQLIKGQTIAVFSEILQQRTDAADHLPAVLSALVSSTSAMLREELVKDGIDLTGVEAVLPPTPLQEAMVSDMIESGFRRYFNHDILEVGSNVDMSKLKQAWATVVEQSPILRTGFVAIDKPALDVAYCQVVASAAKMPFTEVQLGHVDDLSAITENARMWAVKGGGNSGLFQLMFANITGRQYVVLSISHALYDGWSLGLLHQDVKAAYHGVYSPRPSYQNYLDQILHSAGSQADNFWSGFLSGVHPTHLQPENTLEKERSVVRSEAASRHSAAAVQGFCKRHAVSLQALGHACWAAVLSSLSKSLDVTFGVVLSGRDSEAAERLLYPAMNTVATRAILHGKVLGLLRYTQENLANIHQFQHYPLRKAQRAAGSPGRGLFNTLFILQRTPVLLGDDELMRSVDGFSDVEYPVCLEMENVHGSLVWRMACDSAYFSTPDVARILHQLDAVLDFMISDPNADVISFSSEGVSVCSLPPFELEPETARLLHQQGGQRRSPA